MRGDNWRKLICMHNGADIYLNLIYCPYCRLLCQSHINPLISWYAAHDDAHASWIFISVLPSPPVSAPVLSPPCTPGVPKDCALFSAIPVCANARRLSSSCFRVARMAHKSEVPGRDRALRGRHEAMVVAGKRTHARQIETTAMVKGGRGAKAPERSHDEIKLRVWFISDHNNHQ